MMLRRIAFATCAEEGLTADDALTLAPLRAAGIDVVPWIWDKSVAPRDIDGIVLRSCWNYHTKDAAFEAWLQGLRSTGIPIWNPVDTLLWNLHKGYLLDLEVKGADIPSTRLIRRGTTPIVDDLRFGIHAASIVIKPAVSLNGHDTSRFNASDMRAAFEETKRLAAAGDVLVQEFIPEIETVGETSLVFFGGEFSHAIRKTPRPGEFRVQIEHGGTREVVSPLATTIARAAELLQMVGSALLYARVDVIETSDRAILMELEIIDPTLFLKYDPKAAERFARALLAALPSP